MPYKFICLFFVVTPSCCSHIMNGMLELVSVTLRFHPQSKVRFPDEAKKQQFAAMIEAREPLVNDVIGFMDGVSFASQCSDERIIQNAMYSGYVCDTTINNIFAYGPDGKVFFCALNFPGSWSDGAVIARFIPYIKEQLATTRLLLIRVFREKVKRMEFLWVQCQKDMPVN